MYRVFCGCEDCEICEYGKSKDYHKFSTLEIDILRHYLQAVNRIIMTPTYVNYSETLYRAENAAKDANALLDFILSFQLSEYLLERKKIKLKFSSHFDLIDYGYISVEVDDERS